MHQLNQERRIPCGNSTKSGHTGEHLLRPTAKYMKIELTGKLAPCEVCAQAKIRQLNVPKKKDTGYSFILPPSNRLVEGETDTGWMSSVISVTVSLSVRNMIKSK